MTSIRNLVYCVRKGNISMLYKLDMAQQPSCTRFGRMMQKNRWNRQGTAQKNVNLLVFVVYGEAVFSIGGQRYPVNAGDVLLIPAETPYSADTDNMCDYYFFHFTGQLVPTEDMPDYPVMERNFSFDIPPISDRQIVLMRKTELAEDYAKLYGCITSCVDLHASGSYTGRLALDMELNKVLFLLAWILERRHHTASYPMVLDQMLEYIRSNLTKPMTTAELCSYCDISASYAARLFKRNLNTTMTQYITDQKLIYACELMRNTGMNVSQIASYLGFCDVFYFSRRFKAKYGKSPTQMFSEK